MKLPLLTKIIPLLLALLLAGCSDDSPKLQPLLPDAVILAFGDSLTYGSGSSDGNDYPAVLERLSGMEVINAGIPGELSSSGLSRLPELLENHQPELLILIHGGNDILKKKDLTQTASNLEQMIKLARDANVQVVMMAVPKPGLLLGSAPFYEQVAAKAGIPIDLDTLASMLQRNGTKSDTIHPNNKGYKIMAKNLYQLLIDAGAI